MKIFHLVFSAIFNALEVFCQIARINSIFKKIEHFVENSVRHILTLTNEMEEQHDNENEQQPEPEPVQEPEQVQPLEGALPILGLPAPGAEDAIAERDEDEAAALLEIALIMNNPIELPELHGGLHQADSDEEFMFDNDDDDDDDDDEDDTDTDDNDDLFDQAVAMLAEAAANGEPVSPRLQRLARTNLSARILSSSRLPDGHPGYAFQPLRLQKERYRTHFVIGNHPYARSGHRMIASDSHLYVLGGYNPDYQHFPPRPNHCMLFQELWSYNFASKVWNPMLDAEKAENMPHELASNALVMHKNVLISHGGTGYPFGVKCSNDCHVFTINEKPIVHRLTVTGELPTPQYGPGVVIHNDYLYTIGGTTGYDYSCDVYRLSLKDLVWECLYIGRPDRRDDPQGRYRHEVVCNGEHIFVLGGGTSHCVFDLHRLPAFNLRKLRWDYFYTLPDPIVVAAKQQEAAEQQEHGGEENNIEELMDAPDLVQPMLPAANSVGIPMARKCFSCVQHTNSNGEVEAFIAAGLQVRPGDFVSYFSDIWRLNLRTLQWTCIQTAKLPIPLYFHAGAASSAGCMYIFGGIEFTDKGMRRRNDLYKMWVTIPKLSEICWDAMTYYHPHMQHQDRVRLRRAGIPQHFIDRLPPAINRKHAPARRWIARSATKRARRASID